MSSHTCENTFSLKMSRKYIYSSICFSKNELNTKRFQRGINFLVHDYMLNRTLHGCLEIRIFVTTRFLLSLVEDLFILLRPLAGDLSVNLLRSPMGELFILLRSLVGDLSNLMRSLVGNAFNLLQSLVGDPFNLLQSLVGGHFHLLYSLVEDLINLLRSNMGDFFNLL